MACKLHLDKTAYKKVEPGLSLGGSILEEKVCMKQTTDRVPIGTSAFAKPGARGPAPRAALAGAGEPVKEVLWGGDFFKIYFY